MNTQGSPEAPLERNLSGPQLIAYADRLGGSLDGLRRLIGERFAGAFRGVHVLPFYRPFDGADAGFDPEDHAEVDPRLGGWADVAALSREVPVAADVIVNHISARSKEFSEVLELGDASAKSAMFLTFRSVFPRGASEEDLARIYRPRPGLPFTLMRLGGVPRLVWTTFTSEQVDLDVTQPMTWDYLTGVIDRLTAHGVSLLRLDAVGYAGKVPGTTCFMTRAAKELIDRISDHAHERGASVLVELHGHYQQQVDIAKDVDFVYDFALPPLVLHALTNGDVEPLAKWLAVRPANAVTVLDTHDGIGLVDVGPGEPPLRPPGLLSAEQVAQLVEAVHDNSRGTSRLATGHAASNVDIYQLNCTFYDALGQDDQSYLLARALQLFVPGIPQVYYVGLLAGANDMELLTLTGVGRDVNRHHYTPDEIDREMERPVVKAQLRLLRVRASHPAFRGEFSSRLGNGHALLSWRDGLEEAVLDADVRSRSFRLTLTEGGQRRDFTSADLLSVRAGAADLVE